MHFASPCYDHPSRLRQGVKHQVAGIFLSIRQILTPPYLPSPPPRCPPPPPSPCHPDKVRLFLPSLLSHPREIHQSPSHLISFHEGGGGWGGGVIQIDKYRCLRLEIPTGCVRIEFRINDHQPSIHRISAAMAEHGNRKQHETQHH